MALGWILPGITGHDANRPVVGAAGANPEPCGAVADGVDIPVFGDVADVMGDGIVASGDGVSGGSSGVVTVVIGGSGLTPPGESSLDPIGIPDRPTAASAPIPFGEEADAAGLDDALPPAVEHAPDVVPEVPPPSKSAVGLDMPDVIVELAEQPELLPLIVPGTKLLGGAGLMPGVANCVAPNGSPTGPTGAPGPMPSGDVIPMGGVVGEPICARAGPALETVAMMIRMPRCFMTGPRESVVISGSSSVTFRNPLRTNSLRPTEPSVNQISVIEFRASITNWTSVTRDKTYTKV